MSQENFAKINGQNIYYQVHGNGPHKLLMIPGILASCDIEFHRQIANLNPTTFTLVTFDTPGSCRSRPPDKHFNNWHLTDSEIAHQLMLQLGHYRYSVFGFSDSGRTAMWLASQHPESVQKLIVACTNAYFTPQDKRQYFAVRDVDMWNDLKRKKVYLSIYGKEFQQLWTKYIDSVVNTWIPKPELTKIQCPMLIMQADRDVMAPVGHAKFISGMVKQCQVKIFRNASHNIHQDVYWEFNDEVNKFIVEE